jgi:hypothetical protein
VTSPVSPATQGRETLHLIDNPDGTAAVGTQQRSLCGKEWTPHRLNDSTDDDVVCSRCVRALAEDATLYRLLLQAKPAVAAGSEVREEWGVREQAVIRTSSTSARCWSSWTKLAPSCDVGGTSRDRPRPHPCLPYRSDVGRDRGALLTSAHHPPSTRGTMGRRGTTRGLATSRRMGVEPNPAELADRPNANARTGVLLPGGRRSREVLAVCGRPRDHPSHCRRGRGDPPWLTKPLPALPVTTPSGCTIRNPRWGATPARTAGPCALRRSLTARSARRCSPRTPRTRRCRGRWSTPTAPLSARPR